LGEERPIDLLCCGMGSPTQKIIEDQKPYGRRFNLVFLQIIFEIRYFKLHGLSLQMIKIWNNYNLILNKYFYFVNRKYWYQEMILELSSGVPGMERDQKLPLRKGVTGMTIEENTVLNMVFSRETFLSRIPGSSLPHSPGDGPAPRYL